MPDYIEREKALACFRDWIDRRGDVHTPDEMEEYRALESLPAADVRPVVLCRDCKWCHAGYCEKYDDLIPFGCANKPWEDWFCADGVKREKS